MSKVAAQVTINFIRDRIENNPALASDYQPIIDLLNEYIGEDEVFRLNNASPEIDLTQQAGDDQFFVAASQSSFTIQKPDTGRIVEEIQAGGQCRIFIDHIFGDGSYAGDDPFNHLSANVGTVEVIGRVGITETYEYLFTAPAFVAEDGAVLFTWGKPNDDGAITSASTAATLKAGGTQFAGEILEPIDATLPYGGLYKGCMMTGLHPQNGAPSAANAIRMRSQQSGVLDAVRWQNRVGGGSEPRDNLTQNVNEYTHGSGGKQVVIVYGCNDDGFPDLNRKIAETSRIDPFIPIHNPANIINVAFTPVEFVNKWVDPKYPNEPAGYTQFMENYFYWFENIGLPPNEQFRNLTDTQADAAIAADQGAIGINGLGGTYRPDPGYNAFYGSDGLRVYNKQKTTDDWNEDARITPFFDIQVASGDWYGTGYFALFNGSFADSSQSERDGTRQIRGNDKGRQSFIMEKTMPVKGIRIQFSHVRGQSLPSNPLTALLKNSSGTTLATASIPPNAAVLNEHNTGTAAWSVFASADEYAEFDSVQNLLGGQTYYVELEAGANDYWAMHSYFRTEHGDINIDVNPGMAQFSDNSGAWADWSTYKDNRDLHLALVHANAPISTDLADRDTGSIWGGAGNVFVPPVAPISLGFTAPEARSVLTGPSAIFSWNDGDISYDRGDLRVGTGLDAGGNVTGIFFDTGANGVPQLNAETSREVTGIPQNGENIYAELFRWNAADGFETNVRTLIQVKAATSELRTGLIQMINPPNDIARGSFTQNDWDAMFGKGGNPPGTSAAEVSAELIDGRRAINVRMRPVTGQNVGSTRTDAFLSLPTPLENIRIAQRMRFSGTLTPFRNDRHTLKSGVGIRTQINATGSNHNNAGFSIRPTIRGHGDGTPGMDNYTYINTTPSSGQAFGEELHLLNPNGSRWEVPFETWFDMVTDIQPNSSAGASDGFLRTWINGQLLYERTGMKYYSEGAGLIDWLTFQFFWGGNDETWRSVSDSYQQISDVSYGPIP